MSSMKACFDGKDLIHEGIETFSTNCQTASLIFKDGKDLIHEGIETKINHLA